MSGCVWCRIHTGLLLTTLVLLSCGDSEPAGAGDTGRTDTGDGGSGAVNITGDWLILRYHFTSAAGEQPLPSELDQTRFVQQGDAFTQFFGPDDDVGFEGTIVDGVYTQTDGSFTARLTFEDDDHGAGTFEEGEFTIAFDLVRVGSAAFDVAGQWVVDDGSGTPVTVTLTGDTLTIDFVEQRFSGRLGGDSGLLLGDPQPDNGGLAINIRWSAADAAVATIYESSWTPDGAGHTGYSSDQRTLVLSRPGGAVCTTNSQCRIEERCVEQVCTLAVDGSDCTGDDTCPSPLYCAGDLCQDGSSGDFCDDTTDCAQAGDLCDTVCRPREPGEPCGPGDACPGELRCIDATCRSGQTGDDCFSDTDCFEPRDECRGVPTVCTTVVGLGGPCTEESLCTGEATCSNGRCAPRTFTYVEAGHFRMGSPDGEPGHQASEGAVHDVILTEPFFLSSYEVTQQQWQSLMGNNPAWFSEAGGGETCSADCPIETVNWYEALAYMNALSEFEGLEPCYLLSGCTNAPGEGMTCVDLAVDAPDGNPYLCEGYRLPLEAEWEYAYRAGTSTALYNGIVTETGCDSDPNLRAIGWYCNNGQGMAQPVGRLAGNDLGLWDVSGNVSEWVWDYGSDDYPADPVENPLGPEPSENRVNRGGAYDASVEACRGASRAFASPATRNSTIGFRPARSVMPDETACNGDGVCDRDSETAATCPNECVGFQRPCDPFDPFPMGSCGPAFWCEPSPDEGIEGLCTGPAGSGTQGTFCDGPRQCAPGFDCALRECLRYCEPAVDDSCGGERLACLPPDTDFAYCRETCDFDAGVACAKPERTCAPGEFISADIDLCFDALSAQGEEAWVETGDSCAEAGFGPAQVCNGLGVCYDDTGETCTAMCRLEAGMIGVLGHPDCPGATACEDLLSPSPTGVCQRRCESVTPVLAESFNLPELDRGALVGDVMVAGWADRDFPNIADDEATGGTDGDAGLAFMGWIEGGSGQYAFSLTNVDALTSAGTVYYADADVHVETGFNPSFFRLQMVWYNGAGALLDTETLDLQPLLTPANSATDHSEWFHVGLESAMQATATQLQVLIQFGGTSDIGGLQAARVDNVGVTICND